MLTCEYVQCVDGFVLYCIIFLLCSQVVFFFLILLLCFAVKSWLGLMIMGFAWSGARVLSPSGYICMYYYV